MNDILAKAHRLAEKSKTWADLSNALFDPYAKLNALVEQKMKQTGMVAGAEPRVCRNRSHNRGSGTADAS